MPRTKIEHTGRIRTIDLDGQEAIVDEHTRFTLYNPVAGPERWIPGSKSYSVDGEHCNPTGPDEFTTVVSERVLRRV